MSKKQLFAFTGSMFLVNKTDNKEGANDSDGGVGLNLAVRATLSTSQIMPFFGGVSTEAFDNCYWASEEVLAINMKGAMQAANDLQFCSIDVFNAKGNDCSVKKLKVYPTDKRGFWGATMSIYISDPSDKLLALAAHAQKSTIKCSLTQEYLEADEDAADESQATIMDRKKDAA